MTKSTITPLPGPSGFSSDPLTDILQTGARQLLKQAVEAELATLLAAHAREVTDDGRARLVRHDHLPEREVMTGIGPIAVKAPRVRDRGNVDEKIRFASSILPPWLRKTRSIEELLPWLYLKISVLSQGLILDHWRFSRIKVFARMMSLRMIATRATLAFLPF